VRGTGREVLVSPRARGRIGDVQLDLLFDHFGATWPEVREGAIAAEGEGFGAVWLNDHLAGSVHGQAQVLECWTVLTAIAATVPGIAIGPMVLNVANRDPGTLAVMAATLQEVSQGRLLLGLGAGGGRETPYAAEQEALGRTVGTDPVRRRAVEAALATLRSVWSGTIHGVSGFVQPDPIPPVFIGGFGPKMADLAGRVADGIILPGGSRLAQLIEVARAARVATGRDASSFAVITSSNLDAAAKERLERLRVDRIVVPLSPPFAAQVRRLAARR
jgi:alkanesulfonate monooxygenase SsuD/methylene tetrahydromethanopterin reductase-like flavin-dependent oxidoreductase (luciferase family)